MHGRHLEQVIVIFVRRAEILQQQRIDGRVFGELKIGALAGEFEGGKRGLLWQHVPECDAVVVRARFERQFPRRLGRFFDIERQRFGYIANGIRLAVRHGVGFIHGAGAGRGDAHGVSERGLALNVEPEERAAQHRLALERDLEGQLSVVGRKADFDFPVGRLKGILAKRQGGHG